MKLLNIFLLFFSWQLLSVSCYTCVLIKLTEKYDDDFDTDKGKTM